MSDNGNFWAELIEKICPCNGQGWALRGDNYETCFIHYQGQLHPESKALLIDDSESLKEEERLSYINWKIKTIKDKILEYQEKINKAQDNLLKVEMELFDKNCVPDRSPIE